MAEIHHMPGHLIRRLNQISTAVFADHMAANGMDLTPVQFAALSTIAEQPRIDQVGLAGAIAYDKVTIGGVIDRLENKGLVTRRVSPHDRRMRQLRITAAGTRLLERVRPVVRALQDDILAGLDEAGTQHLHAADGKGHAGRQCPQPVAAAPLTVLQNDGCHDTRPADGLPVPGDAQTRRRPTAVPCPVRWSGSAARSGRAAGCIPASVALGMAQTRLAGAAPSGKCGQTGMLKASAMWAIFSHGVMPPTRATSACTMLQPADTR